MLLSTLHLLGLSWLAVAASNPPDASLGSASRPRSLQRPDSKIAKNVLESKERGYCSPSGPIESTNCLYETVESLNADLFPVLHRLVEFPFFRHYKVDLYRECPFWYENGFCMNRACGVEAAEESDIPEKWRAQALSAVRHSEGGGISGCYFREQDFCYIEDDATENGQYIDLSINPERFTGYAGDSAHNVWRAIYEENCFGLSEAALEVSRGGSASGSAAVGKTLGGLASAVVGAGGKATPSQGWGFNKLSEGWGTEMVRGQEVDMCEEKRVYYRVISGLHASISIHICHDYLDQTTGEWAPNLQCFINRLATHPERLANVYFNAVLLLRAVARAAPYLQAYDISTAPIGKLLTDKAKSARKEDAVAKDTLKEVLRLAGADGANRGFDEGDFFTGPDSIVRRSHRSKREADEQLLKEQFKSHFRNVSRIMDCVGCDKCRLWGKLQVSGLGTALKILFELDEKALDPKINPDLLQRSEVVALFNTLHRVSESLAAVEDFRRMYAETQAAEAKAAKDKAEARRHKKQSLPPPTPDGLFGVWSTVAGIAISLVEGVRRSCRGCWELCWRGMLSGPWGVLVERIAGLLGVSSGKLDL